MERRVPNDAVVPDLALFHLKLRLDQGDQSAPSLISLKTGGDDQPKGDEGGVEDHEVDPVRDPRPVVTADIRPFDIDDPWIFPEFPGEQATTDIDGVHLCRPRLEEAVGKTAGGGAYVKGDEAGDGEAEEVESPPEFEPAPADIGVRIAPDPDLRSGADQVPALSTGRSSTRTAPERISARASLELSAIPRSTRRLSRRIFFCFTGVIETQACWDQVRT